METIFEDIQELSDERQLEVTVCPKKQRPFKLELNYTETTITADILETVENIYCEINKPVTECIRKWIMYEHWMGIERRLPDGNLVQLLSQWSVEEQQVRYIIREKKGREQQLAKARAKPNSEIHQLYKEFWSYQREISNLRIVKVKKKQDVTNGSESDPARKGLQMITSVNRKLEDLKMENKKLSSEVSEMNHEATRLTEHLTALRGDSEQVVDLLTQLKAENEVKREKEERKKKDELKLVNKSVLHVQQELEKRQRMTELQDSKIKTVQNDIDHLKATFKSKQRELEQLKEWTREKRQRENNMRSVTTPSTHYNIPSGFAGSQISKDNEPVLIRHVRDESFNCDSQASFESTSSYGSTPGRKSAASMRRRFEDRTKSFHEEESKTFREAKPINKQTKHIPMKTPSSFEDTDGGVGMTTVTRISPADQSVNRLSTLSQLSDTDLSSPVLVSPLSCVRTELLNSSFLTLPIYQPSSSFYGGGNTKQSSISHPNLVSSQSLTNLERRDNNYKMKGILKKRRRRTSGNVKFKNQNGIRFSPEAILLNAAWEGELDVLKNCIKELGSYKVVSSLGVTCLHNAVCSGNLEMIDYCLIQLNCDVNVQDYKGWTPLHCAAAYCTFGTIQLLVSHGASIFMTTSENMTPSDIAKEEMAGSNDEGMLCYQYLQEYEKKLGVDNDGTVYVLFSYTPEYWQRSAQRGGSHHGVEPNEMSIIKGERLLVTQKGEDGWWEVKDMQGAKGVVPSSYLGLYPPYEMVL